MSHEADQLRTEVFSCEHCADRGAFTRSPDSGRFYKFPPIIGATGEADLLFIGINPRRSSSNRALHDRLMGSAEEFAKLAMNRVNTREAYIASDGEEEHYHCHMIVIEAVFGIETAFETKAAVTELMHCASASEPTVLSQKKSPCAERYLGRVIQIVKPKVVIAVGSSVRRHLEKHFREEIRIPVVPMEHPGPLFGKSRAAKFRAMRPTIDRLRELFRLPPLK